jgi:glycosyltransferase involved in cell wall biosynthesis
MRVLIVTEIPAPFRIPLFNALANMPGVELHVAFLAERDPRRTHYRVYRDEFAFEEAVLPGVSLRRGGRWVMVNRGVLRLLRRVRPDVIVVGGWNQPAFWETLVAARPMRTPVLLWVESTSRDARVGGAAAQRVRRLALRLAAGFVVPGRASRAYLEGLGVAGERIVVAPNAVDLRIFAERVGATRADRAALRERLGLDGCVFLYVGRFDPEKGLDVLLRAMRDVPGTLVLIGSGPLEPELRRSEGERVRVVGPLARDELVPWYAAADALVLPSRSEPWGMVLNEAAAAGLPLVATEAVGAAHDLIDPGSNGFRVPVDDEAALGEALRALAEDAGLREAFGRHSLELSERFRPESWAAAVAAFASATVEARPATRRNDG